MESEMETGFDREGKSGMERFIPGIALIVTDWIPNQVGSDTR
jgi:hypothetical protein